MKLILGLGETGLSVAKFLTANNVEFKIADSRIEPPLISSYVYNPAPILGDWKKDLLSGIDEVYISPGIAKSESIYVWLSEQEIPVVSDIELFSRHVSSPIIGITGSNGKSTVTKLFSEMIHNSGYKVAVGGNLGRPALELISDDIDYYVLELSSYQLDYTNELNLFAGVVLNITPDHLDRYDSFQSYVESKLSIYKYCQNCVVNVSEEYTKGITASKYFNAENKKQQKDIINTVHREGDNLLNGNSFLIKTDDIALIGEHNIANIMAAFALGDLLKLPTDAMTKSAKEFKGLEHRLERVATIKNVEFFNDSKATNVISAITALHAIVNSYNQVVLIAGGIAKKEDYSELYNLINERVSYVVLIGISADYLAEGVETSKVKFASSMSEAVNIASKLIENGAILLSPACASFDMFDNFEKRGHEFKDSVRMLSLLS